MGNCSRHKKHKGGKSRLLFFLKFFCYAFSMTAIISGIFIIVKYSKDLHNGKYIDERIYSFDAEENLKSEVIQYLGVGIILIILAIGCSFGGYYI